MPSDFQPHAFDRFSRADVSRTRASGGSGLGLSIVAAVVAAHGGKVQLTSSSSGTAVAVTLRRPSDISQPVTVSPQYLYRFVVHCRIMTNYETPQTPDPTEKPYWTPSDDPKTTSPTNSEAEPSVTSEAAAPVPDYVSAEADAPPASRRRWLIPVGIAAGALTIGLLGGVRGRDRGRPPRRTGLWGWRSWWAPLRRRAR